MGYNHDIIIVLQSLHNTHNHTHTQRMYVKVKTYGTIKPVKYRSRRTDGDCSALVMWSSMGDEKPSVSADQRSNRFAGSYRFVYHRLSTLYTPSH
jgi:hypothetical protein